MRRTTTLVAHPIEAICDEPACFFTLLQNARPVLLDFGLPGRVDIAPWSDRIKLVDAKYDGL